MRTYEETLHALGAPLAAVALDDWCASKLVVARWSLHGAHVVRSRADALRVVVNLGCSSVLRYSQRGVEDITVTRRAGDIGIVPPGPASDTVIEGAIDVAEIFVDATSLSIGGAFHSAAGPIFGFTSDDLMASAVRLFLAAGGYGDVRPRAAAAMFGQTVLQLLASRAAETDNVSGGGLSPSTLRRINGVIDGRLARPDGLPPSVVELAEAARLSLSHFIRAFRKTTGTTPYQYMMGRRRQRAMALLRCTDKSVAEVSDELGFSSPAHFIASFRQRFGATPGDYRNAIVDPAIFGARSPA